MSEEEYIHRCQAGGWDDPALVVYQPGQRPDPHVHRFDAFVLIQSGSMTMALDDGDLVLKPGDWCEVPAGTVHAELGGPRGGRGLLATRRARD